MSELLSVADVNALFGQSYRELPAHICEVDDAEVEALPPRQRARFRLMQAGVMRIQLGQREASLRTTLRALEVVDPHTDLLVFLRLNNEVSYYHLTGGVLADAIERLVTVRWWTREPSREVIDTEWLLASYNLGGALRILGDVHSAHALNVEIYERVAHTSKTLLSRTYTLGAVVCSALAVGEVALARRVWSELEATGASQDDNPQVRFNLAQAQAEMALLDGHAEQALAAVQFALGVRKREEPDNVVYLCEVGAKAALLLGELEQAHALAERMVRAARSYSEGVLEQRALGMLGRVAAAMGDHQRVAELLEQATDQRQRHSTSGLAPMFMGIVGKYQTQLSAQETQLLHTNQRLERNLRELAQARDRAQAAAQARHSFLSSMSHELRTPLHGVMGNADLLQETELNAEQREMLGMIQRCAGLTLSIVDDILDLRKLEEGKVELDPVPFTLVQPAQDVVDSLRPIAQSKGLRLALVVDPELPEQVLGDDRRLQQVLLNLVSNALKFTTVGQVQLTVSPQEDGVRFSVQDTGAGIAPQRLSAIFDAYVQASPNTARGSGGTGLGLPISRHLVALLGGTLQVSSVLGEGAEFHFVLPLASISTLPQEPEAELSLAGVQVLVAEDNPINRMVIERMLLGLQAEVSVVEGGEDALRLALSSRPQVLLLDLHMPDLNGDEVCLALRAEGYTGAVLALTASAMAEDRESCLAAGMDGYLTKPLTRSALAQGVRSALGARAGGGSPA